MTPDTYGDVTAEYQAIHEAAAAVEGQHAVVRVVGPDAEPFLDSLLSQELVGLADGRVVRSLLLGPRGKLRALLWVVRTGDEFLIVSDSAAADSVVEDLTRFKLRVDLTIGAVEPVIDLVGPGAAGVLAAIGLAAVASPLGTLDRFFVLESAVDQLTGAGARQSGRLAYTAARVEMGEPVMGEDVDESTIPQEAGSLVTEAVSFTKGCYLGQELVARIDSRGRVNRNLRGIVLTENRLPPSGAEVAAGGEPVGSITSIAESLLVGAPIGLGLIRHEVEPGAEVEVRWKGGAAGAQIRELPLLASESNLTS